MVHVILNSSSAGAASGLSVEDFGARGDGVTDNTAAFRATVAAMEASPFSTMYIPAGTWYLSSYIDLTNSGVRRVLADDNAIIVATGGENIFYCAGTVDTASVFSTQNRAPGDKLIPVASTTGYAVGDWIFVRSNDLTPNVTAGSRCAMIRQVTQVSTNTAIYIDASFYRSMTTAQNLSIRKATLQPKVTFEGGTYKAIDQTNTKYLFHFLLCEGPDFLRVTIKDSGDAAISYDHCVGGSIVECHISNLLDDEPTEHFGYAVALRGATRGFTAPGSGTIGRVRHAITTTSVTDSGSVAIPASISSLVTLHGEPEATYWGPVYCYDTTNASIGPHEQGYGNVYVPNAHGCFEGVLIRESNAIIQGGQIINCRRNGIRIDHPASSETATAESMVARINGTVISNVGPDGSGGTESSGVSIEYSGAIAHLNDVSIVGFSASGVKVTSGTKLIMNGGNIDGITASAQDGINLASSSNRIRNVRIENCFRGIREETGLSDNQWSWVEFSSNSTNESRVPTYIPTNRHNSIEGNSNGLNDHEVPTSYFVSGRYYASGNFGSTGTSAALTEATLRVSPFYTRQRITIDRIAAEVTSAGGAGSVFRLGIYKDNGSGYPGVKVIDAGTINSTSATAQEITISQVLEPGLYWFGGVIQGAAGSLPTIRTTISSIQTVGASSITTAVQSTVGYGLTSVTGALPDPFTAGATVVATAPKIAVRIV